MDVYGGLAVVREVLINWRNGGDAFTAAYSVYPRPMFGGSVTLGVWGVDAALIQDGDVWAFRTSVVLSWPGSLRVF